MQADGNYLDNQSDILDYYNTSSPVDATSIERSPKEVREATMRTVEEAIQRRRLRYNDALAVLELGSREDHAYESSSSIYSQSENADEDASIRGILPSPSLASPQSLVRSVTFAAHTTEIPPASSLPSDSLERALSRSVRFQTGPPTHRFLTEGATIENMAARRTPPDVHYGSFKEPKATRSANFQSLQISPLQYPVISTPDRTTRFPFPQRTSSVQGPASITPIRGLTRSPSVALEHLTVSTSPSKQPRSFVDEFQSLEIGGFQESPSLNTPTPLSTRTSSIQSPPVTTITRYPRRTSSLLSPTVTFAMDEVTTPTRRSRAGYVRLPNRMPSRRSPAINEVTTPTRRSARASPALNEARYTSFPSSHSSPTAIPHLHHMNHSSVLSSRLISTNDHFSVFTSTTRSITITTPVSNARLSDATLGSESQGEIFEFSEHDDSILEHQSFGDHDQPRTPLRDHTMRTPDSPATVAKYNDSILGYTGSGEIPQPSTLRRSQSTRTPYSPSDLSEISDHDDAIFEYPGSGERRQRTTPSKQLFGHNGLLGRSNSLNEGNGTLTQLKTWGKKVKDTVREKLPSKLEVINNLTSPFLSSDHLLEISTLPISVPARLQSILLTSCEFHFTRIASAFLRNEELAGRLDFDAVQKVLKEWRKNRPQVIEYQLDLNTQLKMVKANLKTVRFHGPHFNDITYITAMLNCWAGLVKEFSIRTFCKPDSDLKRMMVYGYRLLEMLGASEEYFLWQQRAQQHLFGIIRERREEIARQEQGHTTGENHGVTRQIPIPEPSEDGTEDVLEDWFAEPFPFRGNRRE